MTYRDLAVVVKHYWRLVVLAPIICALIGIGASKVLDSQEFEATAKVVALDPTGSVQSSTLSAIMVSTAKQIAEDNDADVNLSVEMGTGEDSQALLFRAVGANGRECVDAANDAALETVDVARMMFEELDQAIVERRASQQEEIVELLSDKDLGIQGLIQSGSVDKDYRHLSFFTTEATEASVSELGFKKILLLSVAVGLIISICLILALDAYRQPIRSRSDLQRQFDLPVLVWPGLNERGRRLWLDVQSLCDCDIRSLALVPLSHSHTELLGEELAAAAQDNTCDSKLVEGRRRQPSDEVSIVSCCSLSDSYETVRVASEASAVVVVATVWEDSKIELEDVLQGLRIASTNIAGLALVPKRDN